MRNEELFRDVLNERTTPHLSRGGDFEAEVFRKTVGTARHIRRVRVATRGLMIVMIAMVALLAFFQFRREQEILLVTAPAEPPVLEKSYTPLQTKTFHGIIRSERIAPVLRSKINSVAILTTREADPGDLRFLTDDELLSFFPGQAVAIVKRGPSESELVFLGQN